MTKTIEVKFETELPVEATDQQIQKWLEYVLGATGGIKSSNPLSDYGLEALFFSVDFQ